MTALSKRFFSHVSSKKEVKKETVQSLDTVDKFLEREKKEMGRSLRI